MTGCAELGRALLQQDQALPTWWPKIHRRQAGVELFSAGIERAAVAQLQPDVVPRRALQPNLNQRVRHAVYREQGAQRRTEHEAGWRGRAAPEQAATKRDHEVA